MKTYTLDEVTDRFIGKKGTPERDEFDAEVNAAVEAYKMGETLRAERERQNMSRSELGAKVGLSESTVSRVENGRGTSMSTLSRILRALDIKDGFFDMGRLGRVAL